MNVFARANASAPPERSGAYGAPASDGAGGSGPPPRRRRFGAPRRSLGAGGRGEAPQLVHDKAGSYNAPCSLWAGVRRDGLLQRNTGAAWSALFSVATVAVRATPMPGPCRGRTIRSGDRPSTKTAFQRAPVTYAITQSPARIWIDGYRRQPGTLANRRNFGDHGKPCTQIPTEKIWAIGIP